MNNGLFEWLWKALFAKTTQAGLRNAFVIFIVCITASLSISVVNVFILINEQFHRYQNEIIKQAGLKLDGIVGKVTMSEQQVIWLVSDSLAFRPGNTPIKEMTELRDLEYNLRNLRRTSNDINEIYVIMNDNRVISSASELYNKEILLSQPWLPQADINAREHITVPTHSAEYKGYENDDIMAVSFVRKVHSLYNYNEAAATIQIDLDYRSIAKVFKDVYIDSTQYIYILDESNRFIYDTEQAYIGRKLSDVTDQNLVDISAQSGIYPLKNQIIVKYQLEAADWTVITLIDYSKVFWSLVGSMRMLLIIPIVTILFFWILARYLSHMLSEPIREMVEHMENIQYNPMTPIELHIVNEDIRILCASYNNMLKRIEKLIINNKKKENERAKAEYRAHTAQINPHFLYNTLETMRSIALQEGIDRVADIAKSIAVIFKYSIDNRHEFVTLEQETNNVKNYMKIQYYRFREKVELFSHIEEDVMQAKILKFVLQPMVENAMKHGYDSSKEKNIIVIKAQKRNGSLVIEVFDNGVGIEKEKLERLKRLLASGQFSTECEAEGDAGIGLMNVHARIQHTFGKEYGIVINSEPKVGTGIILRFPFIEDC